MRKQNHLNLWKRFVFVFLCMYSISTYAQNINVTGIITDTKNEPLIGVSVMVQGTGSGTITDYDGKYVLSDIAADAKLEITYVGMQKQIIDVNGRTSIICFCIPT